MIWLVVLGIFIAATAVTLGMHHSIERIGNSDFSWNAKTVLIIAIAIIALVIVFAM